MTYIDVLRRNHLAALKQFGKSIPLDSTKALMYWNSFFPNRIKTLGVGKQALTDDELAELREKATKRLEGMTDLDLATDAGCGDCFHRRLFHDLLPDGTHTVIELAGGMQKIIRAIDLYTEQVIFRDTATGEEFVYKETR